MIKGEDTARANIKAPIINERIEVFGFSLRNSYAP
jgi:hypothetical protein